MKSVYSIGSVRVQIVRERVEPVSLSSPEAVIKKFAHLKSSPKEQLWALYLDGKNQLLADKLISLGTAKATMIDLQDITRTALLLNAQAVILLHNHPSGIPKPSDEDLISFKKIRQALDLFSITVHDFLIIGSNSGYSIEGNEEVRV